MNKFAYQRLFNQSIKYQSPKTIPVTARLVPAAYIKHGKELQRIAREYPQFYGLDRVNLKRLSMKDSYRSGRWVDEWGCVWDNIDEGMDSIVTEHPVKSEEDVFSLQIPQNRDGRLPHGFMYLRLLDLCGFEDTMVYFAEEGETIQTLIDKVQDYNVNQVRSILHWWDKPFTKMYKFGDDLGMQTGLAIGAERWRKYLKPCYKKLYGMIKEYNKNAIVYMHTDGQIFEIMPDLQECGVDVINPQFRANGLDNLVRVCRGKIPIRLDLDRQMFPFATRSQIFDHVGQCVEELYLKEGGLSLYAEISYDTPLDNVVAVLDALEKYRHYKG